MGIAAAFATLGTALSAGSVGTAAIAATATVAGTAAVGAGGALAVAGAVGTIGLAGLTAFSAISSIFGSQPGTPSFDAGQVSSRDDAADRITAEQDKLKKRVAAGNSANRISTSPLGAIVSESSVGLRKLFGGEQTSAA